MLAQIHCPLVFCSSCLMFLFWKLDVFVGVLSTSAVCSVHRRVPERASGSHSCWGELVMLCTCSPGNEVGWDSRRRWYKHLWTWAIAYWHPTSSQNLSPSQTAPHCCPVPGAVLRFCPMLPKVADPSSEPALPALQPFIQPDVHSWLKLALAAPQWERGHWRPLEKSLLWYCHSLKDEPDTWNS